MRKIPLWKVEEAMTNDRGLSKNKIPKELYLKKYAGDFWIIWRSWFHLVIITQATDHDFDHRQD